MATVVELHPADTAARCTLRHQLIQARDTLRLSQRALGRLLDIGQPAVMEMEHRRDWRLHTVHRWAAAVGRRLELTPTGLGDPAPADLETLTLQALRPSPARDTALLIDHLRRVRLAEGVTLREMARRIGTVETAAGQWERERDNVLLATAQRWTRALGGVLHLDLQEVADG